ncbi:MAG: sensor histidine kinase [Acidobacteria bacterium]|nr:sensor histidine kinase [Acidobacteriota bacterium]
MKATLSELLEQYSLVLREYLAKPDEGALLHAYEIGRSAVSDGLGVLDMVEIHNDALAALFAVTPGRQEIGRLVKAGGTFLAESLSAFEMTHRGFREANARLRQLNEALGRHANDLERSEAALRQLSSRLLKLQDDERRRVARELHDSTGQSLTALGLNLSILQSSVTGMSSKAATVLSESLTLAEQCLSEIRTFSYLLHPPLLDELGLVAALRWYGDGFAKRSGIRVHLDVPSPARRLPQEVEIALFRITQESLANIHRHSGSPSAEIRLALEPRQVVLEIKDEGRGIATDRLRECSESLPGLGVGILGMRERMRQMGGRLEIDSAPGGTTVRAVVPFEQTEIEGTGSH